MKFLINSWKLPSLLKKKKNDKNVTKIMSR